MWIERRDESEELTNPVNGFGISCLSESVAGIVEICKHKGSNESDLREFK